MAVIIRDVDVPERCSQCFAYDFDYDRCILYTNGVPSRYYSADLEKIPDWCELEEVTE